MLPRALWVAAWLIGAGWLPLAGCAATPPRPQQAAASRLVLDCTPADAEVYLDGQYFGQARAFGGRGGPVRAGAHRLELRRDGYFSSLHTLHVVPGVALRLGVQLRKQPF